MLGESQTLRVFIHVILGVIELLWPVVPFIDDLMGERAASRMIPTIAFMNFLHHSPSFVWSEAPQVGVNMKFGVRLLV